MIIDFNEIQQPAPTEPTVLATAYHLTHTAEDGTIQTLELNGEEIISTTCPVCDGVHKMSLYDFIALMQDGDLYGTVVYCSECSKKVRHEQ